MKSKRAALIVCIVGGWCGAHKFYEENYLKGVLYFCTIGGFLILWIRDIIRYAGMEEELYDPRQIENERKEKKRQERQEKNRRALEERQQRQEALRNRTCPRCGSRNYHAFVEEVGLGGSRREVQYVETNISDNRRAIRRSWSRLKSRFVCDDCGKIFD